MKIPPDNRVPIACVDLHQALTDIVESIAAEDAALGAILSAQDVSVRAVHGASPGIGEFVSVSESAASLVKSISRLQMLLHLELGEAEEMLQRCAEFDEEEAEQ